MTASSSPQSTDPVDGSVRSPVADPSAPRAGDRVRQVVVLVGALVALAAAAVGSGALGGQPIAEAADGALSADATVVAPGTPAFSIWSVVYAGLLVVAVVQALPGRAGDPLWRDTSWWVLASMLLNALWIAVVQAGALWGSVLVIAALLAVLGVLLVRLARTDPVRAFDGLVLGFTVGLYLGWVCVATLANVAAALSASDVGDLVLGATGWGVVLVTLGAAVVVAVALRFGHRPAVTVTTGLAAGWGLAWIAVARTQGPLVDAGVSVAAGVAAAIAVLAPLVVVVARRRPA